MKPGKYILFLLSFFTSLSINAQESPCDQFLSLFEAGEYEEVTTLLEECRNNSNLDQDQKNEFDFYLNISYGFLNDYNRFDVVKMERLIHKNDFKNIKHIVSAYFVLSHYYAYNSIYDKVLELIDITLFFAKQFISYESIDYAMILTSFASIYGDSGNFEKAIEFESQVSNILKSIYGENHINYAKSLSDLAFYHLSMTNYKASVKLEEESLIIKRQLLGEEHTSCALSLSNLSMSHYFLGDYQKSVELGEEALRIEKKLLGVNHPDYASSLDNLSNIYLKLGDYSKALDLGQQGLLINKTLFGEDHPEYAKSINSLALIHSFSGDYKLAIELGEESLCIIKEVHGKNHPRYATLLDNLSGYYSELGDYPKALELEKQVFSIISELFDESHPDYAISLANLASCYADLGDYSKALELEKQSLSISKEHFGENHPDYASSLGNIASYLSSLGDYQKAKDLVEQALAIEKQIYGENHPEYAKSIGNLAGYYSDLGNYSTAIELGEQALSIRKEIYGENHPDYATMLSNLASYYSDSGDYLKGIELVQQALLIRKESLGVNHPDYVSSLNNMASYYLNLGIYSKAVELGKRALNTAKQALGENHPLYATTLGNLANYHAEQGDYQNAIEFEQEALFIRKKLFGENHPDYATSLNSLASYNFSLGNYQRAIELGEKALYIRKHFFGMNHPKYATSLDNLAGYYSELGDYTKAINLRQKAKDIRKELLGENHPTYINSLNNLAHTYSLLGNYSKSIELVQQSLKIQKQTLGENHPDYATLLDNLAGYYSELGDYTKAINLSQKAKDIRKELLGENHPHYVLSLENLSFHYFCSKDAVQSSVYLGEVFHKKKEQIQTQFNWLTENERLPYWRKQSWWFLNLPFMAYNSNEFRDFINFSYDGALLSKALMLNSSIELSKLLIESGDEKVIEKTEELRTIHHTLNRLYEKPISERFLDTDSLEIVAQNLERDLLNISKEYGDYTNFMSITWQDVQKGLGEKDVAIEFVEFPVLKSDSTMYAALVLRKDWEGPQMIPLFEKREIEQYLTQTPDKQYSGFVGKQLYKLMWKPLEEVIQKGDAVHFSAAGVYHQLALEYLPTEDGTPLSENYNFHRLSSTRQLALEEQKTVLKNATLYGGIQYDVNPSEMLAESNKYQEDKSLYAYRGMSVDSLRGGNWVPLDNTVKEVEFISNELATNKIETALFTGTNANEESIKALSGKKTNILHLATHGFFLPIEETRKVNYYQMIGTNDHPTPDMSMRRSGLIMAGGNRAWIGDTIPQGIDDGVLTAQEISVLDFREMDLVVLSACETGLGDIDTSEGVFGLQRAFKKAGAKTLIMSLWKVNDEVTKSLMNKFYKSLLSGKTKHDAFLEAQQFIRFRHPEPQNWAAFIMLD